MKKLSKKAWKEYFENDLNWSVEQTMQRYGIRVSNLNGTDLYVLENWNVPKKYMREMGLKSKWRSIFYFIVHEDEEGNIYMEEMMKTASIDYLWKAQEGLNA